MANESAVSVETLDKIAGRFGFPQGTGEAQPETEESAVEQTAEVTEGEQGAVEVDDGLADLDWEGQSIKVPKGIKEALMRTDDYTRKTQELAEHRRSVEQMQALAESQRMETEFTKSITHEQQEINVIDAYLQQVAKLDWSQMPTDQMMRQKIEIDSIKERRMLLADSINGKRTKFTQDMQAKILELRGKAKEIASKSIQGFGEETEKTIREYAKSEGLADTEIDNVLLDPRSYRVLWKASQFDKIKAGTQAAGEKAKAADKVLRPGVAGQKMPKEVARDLNFKKAMNNAKTSGQKAQVIEDRLAGRFAK